MAQADEDKNKPKKPVVVVLPKTNPGMPGLVTPPKPKPKPAPKPAPKAPTTKAPPAPANPGQPGMVTPPSTGSGGGPKKKPKRIAGLAAPLPTQKPPQAPSPFQRALRGAITLGRAGQAVQQAPQRFAASVVGNRIADATRITNYVRPTLRSPGSTGMYDTPSNARDDRWTLPTTAAPAPRYNPNDNARMGGEAGAGYNSTSPRPPTVTANPLAQSNAAQPYNPGLMQSAALSLDQMKALNASPTAPGGGGGYAGVPNGVDPVWYNQFIAEHNGQTPEEVYQYSDNPLGQALWDKAWGDQFLAGNYRPPTEEDWRNTYGMRGRLYNSGANIYGQGGSGGGGGGGWGGGGGNTIGNPASATAIPQFYNAGFNLAFGTPPSTYYSPERGGEKQMQADYFALHDAYQNALGRPVDPAEWESFWRELLSYKAGRPNQLLPLSMADILGYANRMTKRGPQPPDVNQLGTTQW